MSILTLDQVSKTYQNYKAVDRVSFSVPEACIYGLLGPNGAGKTTTIRMITGITHPDSGDIYIRGKRVNNTIPQEIGYMPEERGLYKKMTVWDHLMYLAQLKGMSEKIAREELRFWIERLEMKSWYTKKVEELSKGMTQKAQFIATVIHKPEILILDEPFSGLDPISTNMIKDEISRLQSLGTTIIFSTHRMEQVEEICERMVLINKGQNVLEGNVEEIRKSNRKHLFRLISEGELPITFPSQFNESNRIGKKVEFYPNQNVTSADLLRYFLDQDIHVTSFEEIFPSINDIFIQTVEKSNQL
ncbi:MAG: ATP-binding cassette domain-containing protein [Saprospiraceae bacterium]|nr:ATP-binding cassette domain-containing protein [Saprospiraceae bacterium]